MVNLARKQQGLCPMPLGEFLKLCRSGQCLPDQLATQVESIGDFAALIAKFGYLDPLSAIRPGACEMVIKFDKTVEVPPATIDAGGKVIPSQAKLIKICASMHQSLVVEELQAQPSNLTATESGEVIFPRNNVFGFSEAFCLPYEPGDGNGLGTFSNVEHIVLCPGAGFDVYARNHSPFSPALFNIHFRGWATC